jgi:aspartate-semialdehyde dehydrogenase
MTKEKQYNKVIQDTNKFLNKKKWLNFDVFCIVYGVLYSVFEMVYFLAPNKKEARRSIIAALKNYESENE